MPPDIRPRDFLLGQIVFYFQHHERTVRPRRVALLSEETTPVFALEYAGKQNPAERGVVLFALRENVSPIEGGPGSGFGCFRQGDLWSYDLEDAGLSTLEAAADFARTHVPDVTWLDAPLLLKEWPAAERTGTPLPLSA